MVKAANARRKALVEDFKQWGDQERSLETLQKGKIYIYAYRVYPKCTRVAYYDEEGNKDVIFDDIGFRNFLQKCEKTLWKKLSTREIELRKNCPIYYMPHDAIVFYKDERGRKHMEISPYFQNRNLSDVEKELEQRAWKFWKGKETKPSCLTRTDFIDFYRTSDMKEEGEYIVYLYAEREFRGNTQTILFLEDPRMEDICGRISVRGKFLQEEIFKCWDLGKLYAPIHLKIGTKMTSQKKKDRMVRISLTTVKGDDCVGFDRNDLFNAIQYDMMGISTLDTHYEKEKENTLDVTEYVEGKKTKANVPYVNDIPIQKKSCENYGKKLMDGVRESFDAA